MTIRTKKMKVELIRTHTKKTRQCSKKKLLWNEILRVPEEEKD